MKPSNKSPEMEQYLTDEFGFDRRKRIEADLCCPPPTGCGKKVTPMVNPQDPNAFADALSLKEYSISGLCQACQDEVFNYDQPFDSNEE